MKAKKVEERPEEAEERSFYSPDFRETLANLDAQARRASRWGKGLLVLALLLFLLGSALFGNYVVAGDQEGKGGESEGLLPRSLRGPANTLAWLPVVLVLMHFAYQLLLRSWELEDKLVRIRVLADYAAYPAKAIEMAKALDKESERALASRRNPVILKLLWGPKKEARKQPPSPSQ
jgi:hypothetical protein